MMIDLSEIGIITRFIEGSGYRVKDVKYFHESISMVGAGAYYFGNQLGHIDQHQFFFGNISIEDTFQGVINLANKNQHLYIVTAFLYGGVEMETVRSSFAIGAGAGLLGDGTYLAERRLYGIGGNKITLGLLGCGASTVSANIDLNGLMWTII